jgi:predicted nucleic acid-binding protein
VERLDAVLDASFWINAERSGLSQYLLDYFRLSAPPRVVEEVTFLSKRLSEPPSAAVLFAAWQARGLVEMVAPEGGFGRFDAGENEAIALARERGWVLLIDDEAPRHYSRGPLGLRVIDSPAFAVFLYDQRRLLYAEAVGALRRSQAGQRMVGEALIALELLARRKGDR